MESLAGRSQVCVFVMTIKRDAGNIDTLIFIVDLGWATKEHLVELLKLEAWKEDEHNHQPNAAMNLT